MSGKSNYCYALLGMVLYCFAGQAVMAGRNPITATFENGTTSFSAGGSGTANYLVHVDSEARSNPPGVALVMTAFNLPTFATQLTGVSSGCTTTTTTCANPMSLKAGESCCLMLRLDGSVLTAGDYPLQPHVKTIAASQPTYQGQAASALNVTVSSGSAILNAGTSNLALSIGGLSLNGSSSGLSRTIKITNSGDATATNLSVSYPAWPSGTTATSDCGTTLAASGGYCTITVAPGTTPTSDCSTAGIAPTPGVITVSATGVTPVTTNVVVLNYACIYQGGYVFAMTETADTTQSIGGTVVTQSNQATEGSPGIIWSSNGVGAALGNVSYDIIPGIAETSTSDSPVPTYGSALSYFNTTYSNGGVFPFPSSGSFQACNGRTAGQCNSDNIAVLYGACNTGYGVGSSPYTLSSGPTNLTYYAAGLCTATISGYGDWYLPAICEMGPASNGLDCVGGTQNMFTNLNILRTGCSGSTCLAGFYWSSTEVAGYPQDYAWNQFFASGGGSVQSYGDKYNTFGVRCSRALTP